MATGSGSASAVVSAAGYPDGDDLRTRIEGLAAWTSTALDGLDFATKIAAAVKSFESDTGYSPFLSSGSDTSRTFDPPNVSVSYTSTGGGRRLDFRAGLVSLTSLTLSGTTLTSAQDFYLYPRDAASKGEPYTGIDFAGAVYGLPAAIVVTGEWGYTDTLPDDAKEAILSKGLLLLYPDLSILLSRGLYSIQEEMTTVRFSGSGNVPLGAESAQWRAVYSEAVKGYRRVSI